jgi:hypothetical protein
MNNLDESQFMTSENKPPDLIGQLIQVGEKLPDDLRRTILAAAPDIVPDLIGLIADALKDDEGTDESLQWAAIHAAELLDKIGDARAIPVLQDVLEQCDPIDYLSSNARLALKDMGEKVIEPCLERYFRTTDDKLRNDMAAIACETGASDERLYQIASETLDRDLTSGANCFYGLGDERAVPLLNAKFDEFKVDQAAENPFAGHDLIELKAAIEHLGGELTPEQQQKLESSNEYRRKFMEVMDKLMDQKEAGGKNQPATNRAGTVVNERKIGRNEPCWCGSGKIYKKCHLPLER